MFPKRIIGKYLGEDPNGVTIGKVKFPLNSYIECTVNEEMFTKILELCTQGVFYLFEFASVKQITDSVSVVTEAIEQVANTVTVISDHITVMNEELDTKYDDVEYEDNNLNFYSNDVILKTITLPLPERPREIELSKNETHILWRIKPIGKEFIKWEELISIQEITGPTYDDTTLIQMISDLTDRVAILEGGI